jgi:hypothetical protein
MAFRILNEVQALYLVCIFKFSQAIYDMPKNGYQECPLLFMIFILLSPKWLLTGTILSVLFYLIQPVNVLSSNGITISKVDAKAISCAGNITSDPSAINVTIGDLILEGKGDQSGLRGLKILDVGRDKEPKIEVSYITNVTIRGGINATDMGTMWSITNPDRSIYSEGQGTLTTATGGMATYTFRGVGQYDGTLRNHGSYFFSSNTFPRGELSFLNNMIGVYIDEIDPSGKGIARVWELR